MLNTILVNLDKTLEKTSFRTIYQKESRIDEIQFLIDSKLLGEDIQKNYKIILQAILPIEDKEHNSPTTNKMRYMDLEESKMSDSRSFNENNSSNYVQQNINSYENEEMNVDNNLQPLPNYNSTIINQEQNLPQIEPENMIQVPQQETFKSIYDEVPF